MEIKNNNGEVIANINLSEGFSLRDLIRTINPSKTPPLKLKKLKSIRQDPNNRKYVIFDFETSVVRYSLTDKKFCRENGVFLSLNAVNNLPFDKPELRKSQNTWHEISDFWINIQKLAEDKWLKTFFCLMDIWANGKQNGDNSVLYISKRDKLSRCRANRLVEDKIFIDCLESFAKIPQIQDMDEVALSRLYCELTKYAKNKGGHYKIYTNFSKSNLSVDNWFIERSNKSLGVTYGEGEILGENIASYLKANSLGLSNMFKYVFDTYKGCLRLSSIEKISELVKKYNYEEKRLADYLFRDVYSQGLEISDSHYGHNDAVTMLHDYAKMNKDMEKDFDKYPKYLSTYHDIATKNYEIKKDQIVSKKFKARVKELANKGLLFKNDNYSIILPESSKDLVKEGQSLNHCVASYYNRMAEGETIIVFLRKNESFAKSLVTIEIEEEGNKFNIIQAKGVRNSAPDNPERIFIQKYLDYLNKDV